MRTVNKYKQETQNSLPMGILGMRTCREFDFCVSALECNVEPCKECMDVCSYLSR